MAETIKKFFSEKRGRLILLSLILLAGIGLRLVNLDRADMLSDPAINAFRAIGPLDFLSSNTQTTPRQWFETEQWWQNLSFHDHPPLTFWAQNIFFRLWGVSEVVSRLPFVILGILSIWLIYFLGKRIFNSATGLLAAGLLAVSGYHVWLSRSGYLESFVIFFIIGTLFFSYQGLRRRRYLYWAAVFLALGVLSKYTIIFLFPGILIFYLVYDRQIFRQKHFYLSILLFLAIISPVIIYNFNMLAARGHLDAGLSSLLGQHPYDFRQLKRSLQANYLANLSDQFRIISRVFNPMMLAGIIASLIYFTVRWRQSKNKKRFAIILFPLLFLLVEMIFFTNAWFFTLYLPFLLIMVAYGVYKLFLAARAMNKKIIPLLAAVMIFFGGYALYYSVNSNLLDQPKGPAYWTYSEYRSGNLGYGVLDDYLRNQLADYHGNLSINFYADSPQISAYIHQLNEKPLDYLPRGGQPADFIYVYDPRIDWFALMWLFEARKVYQQFSFVSIDQLTFMLANSGLEPFKANGIEHFYYIYATGNIVNQGGTEISVAEILKSFIENKGISPLTVLNNDQGEEIFIIYDMPPAILAPE